MGQRKYTHTQELDLRHITDLTPIVWLFSQGPLLSLTAEYGSWGGEWCPERRHSPLSNLTLGHARKHGRNLAFLATSTEEDLPRPGVRVITTRFSGERYHHYPHTGLTYENPSTLASTKRSIVEKRVSASTEACRNAHLVRMLSFAL